MAISKSILTALASKVALRLPSARIGCILFLIQIILISMPFNVQGFMLCQQTLRVSLTRPLPSHLHLSSFPYYNTKNMNEDRQDGDDDDEEDGKQEWLSWMTSGLRPKRYSFDEVRMREDERLGGLPRYGF
jgi:hypothetical protein